MNMFGNERREGYGGDRFLFWMVLQLIENDTDESKEASNTLFLLEASLSIGLSILVARM